MRGRKARPLDIAANDVPILQHVSQSRTLCWFQVQHARILLAVWAGQRIQSIASQMQCDEATVWRICRRYEQRGLAAVLYEAERSGRPQRLSPPGTRPDRGVGLLGTHRQRIVKAISPRTVRQILHNVDLQPHRTRYWKTSRLDAEFKERAEKVLWCYGNAENLAAQGLWVVCADEIPNFQVLEREPIRRAIPGSIEQQEFDYTRHGTVNLLMLLIVHTGQMALSLLEKKDSLHYTKALTAFRRRHRRLKGIYLIQDGDPSHTAAATGTYFHQCHGWWRPRFTPVHASWLNQGEMLNAAFGFYYLKRTSWPTREEFMDHMKAAEPEYNRRYAHPFEWTWTNQQMRRWFEKHRQ
jgi:transposase